MEAIEEKKMFSTIFVGGAMRTGTSLLQHTLCSTPTANDMMFECHHLTSHIRIYAEWRNKNERALTDYFADFEELRDFTQAQLSSLLEMIHRQQHAPQNLVLKHPELTPLFPVVSELLPEAKFVIIVRDPRDAIASMLVVAEKQRQLGRSGNIVDANRDMRKLVRIFLSFYRSTQELINKTPNKVKLVKYEELVVNPHNLLSSMAAFTGLDFSEFDEKADWVYTRPRNRNKSFDTDIRGKSITNNSIGNYKSALSSKEIEQIGKYASGYMKAFGYNLTSLD